jgi:hypothetical protein
MARGSWISVVSSVKRLLGGYTILPTLPPHAVCALLWVVHRHGPDLATIEANTFDHVESHELFLCLSEAMREESGEGFMHLVEQASPARRPLGCCFVIQ